MILLDAPAIKIAESAVLGSPPPQDARSAVVEQLSKTAVSTTSPA
jgi:hypothetical protein